MRTLYLCYFGLREPLVQTQVVPYLRHLAKRDISVHLLTFEPDLKGNWSVVDLKSMRETLCAEGITWHHLPYHKSPSLPATLLDIFRGALKAVHLARRERINILHARAHIPLAMALIARALIRVKIIFDIRGLIADEYVDSGIWRQGSLVYRVVKGLESFGISQSDQIIALTEKLKTWIVSNHHVQAEKIQVIPCCVDLEKFIVKQPANPALKFELVYAGSVTGLYMLEEMGRFFMALKRRYSNAFFRILTASPPSFVKGVFQNLSIDDDDYSVDFVNPGRLPEYLANATAGISFRKPTFSQIAASPTKIPEYLAAGLPVISNSGIGDTDNLLDREKVGVILRDFDDATMEHAIECLARLLADPNYRNRSAMVALKNFDLVTVGGDGYSCAYGNLDLTVNLTVSH